MIYYESICRYCKQSFKIIEGTKQYQAYKRNPNGSYSCEACNRKIEDDSRKYLFQRD